MPPRTPTAAGRGMGRTRPSTDGHGPGGGHGYPFTRLLWYVDSRGHLLVLFGPSS